MYEILDLNQLDGLQVGADPVSVVLSEPVFNLMLSLLSVVDDRERWEASGLPLSDSAWSEASTLLGLALSEVIPNA